MRNEKMIITFGNHKEGMMMQEHHHKECLLAPPDKKQGRTFASHIRWDKLYQLLSLSNEWASVVTKQSHSGHSSVLFFFFSKELVSE